MCYFTKPITSHGRTFNTAARSESKNECAVFHAPKSLSFAGFSQSFSPSNVLACLDASRRTTCHHRCGVVVTEAFYFLSDVQNGSASLAPFRDSRAAEVRDVFTPDALTAAFRLMSKYADISMDFPDATLVWIAGSSGIDGSLTFGSTWFLVVPLRKKPSIQA
jgi:hypothetical protein